ncbi:MAG TPA: 4-carboxy-4-hydroxy-2-oxoadipate aldolase/oxaloacetate decarboxylase [Bacillota bacterium]|nr:4-carboxy-4-hydroxy-2-oxoadipate aldolase/oxaloacetate decarboxylase [Bacillota bacterium]HOA16043.1 4-carboxy-4-hydroxy-2-oxoadipate aldolase/oxaloacetate decarboxylase [Bacillota bacterium]HOG52857.1 4-carboxy-4-hydroxy-2-oxoadipate aldolase/oxaloacetate decarboxylase [Bacillota bacterium]
MGPTHDASGGALKGDTHVMIHVRTKIERPPQEIIEAYRGIPTATIHEAGGRKGYIDSNIRPIAKGMRICGPAFTVLCAPGDNLMLHKALEKAQPGDIIVASVGGGYQYGYFGDLMAVSAMARKVGGLAIDGCVRDTDDIAAMGFNVFSRGYAIRGTVKETLGLVNYPIVFGGHMVNPGDLIVGDEDGMVCVALKDVKDTLEKSIKRTENEILKAQVLQTGVSSVKNNKLDVLFEQLGLVEE